MRLVVIHNAQGDIQSLIAVPSGAPPVQVSLTPGQLIAQVDAPDLAADAGTESILERLADFRQNYKVEVEARIGRLTQKTGE